MKNIGFILILYVSSLRVLYAQCSVCDITISSSSSVNQTLNGNNQRVCITGGTYTGTITLNGIGNSICITSAATVGAGATFTLNGSNITVENYGVVNLSGLSLNTGGIYNNRGTTNISGTLNLNGNPSSYNQILGITNLTQQFNVNTNATLNISGGTFNQTNNSTSSNNNSGGTIQVNGSAKLNIAGNFINNGTVNVQVGTINVGGSFTNNSGATYNSNNGLLTVGGNATNNGNIQTNGAGCNKMQITGSLTNNSSGSINGTAGAQIDLCLTGSLTNTGSISNRQADCTCNVSLPITLLAFEGKYEQDLRKIKITWLSQNDEMGNKFEIEKSTDGTSFQRVVQIDAIQNITPTQYNWIDEVLPQTGYCYYRLKLIERVGKVSYSPTIAIKIPLPTLQIYPNPAQTTIFIKIPNLPTLSKAYLYNAQGTLFDELSLIQEAQDMYRLDVRHLPQGTYNLIINAYREKICIVR